MSTQLTPAESERFQNLMMKAVDGEITSEEQKELQRFIDTFPECKREFDQYKKLKEVTTGMKLRVPAAEFWDHYWLGVYNRLERGLAWIFFSVGFIILLTYGGFKAIEAIIADPDLETIVKVGLVLTLGGFAMLIASVVREKLSMRRKDPYREVQR